jgi:hypothetical protein
MTSGQSSAHGSHVIGYRDNTVGHADPHLGGYAAFLVGVLSRKHMSHNVGGWPASESDHESRHQALVEA